MPCVWNTAQGPPFPQRTGSTSMRQVPSMHSPDRQSAVTQQFRSGMQRFLHGFWSLGQPAGQVPLVAPCCSSFLACFLATVAVLPSRQSVNFLFFLA